MYGHYSTMAEHELLGKESACGMAERDPDRDSLDGDSLEGEWRSEGEERTISVEHGHYPADGRSAGGLTAPLSPSTPRSYIIPTDRRGLIVSSESVTNPNNQTIQSSPIRQNHYQQKQQQYCQLYESQERGDDIGRCLEPVDRLLRVENARRSPKRRLTPGDLATVTSLGKDSAPIGPDLIAAHRNTSTPQQQRRHLSDRVDNTHEPTRRKECMFFVDLDDLPAPTQSSNGTFKCSKRPAQRSESSDSQRSVYLYIDLENGVGGGSSGQAGRSRGHSSGSHAALARAGFGRQGMSASYHGQSTLENGDSDDYHYDYHDDDDDQEASCSVSRDTLTEIREGRGSSGRRGSSGFLTMTGTEEPQQVANNRPPTLPPQLSSRLHALELHRRRRRNHSIGGVEMSSATATACSRAPAAGTAMTSTCSAPKIAPRTTLSRGDRASSAAAATTTTESSPPTSSRSRNNRGRGDFAASPSAANMTSKQQHQQSRSSARRISTGAMSSPGGSGGGGSSSSYSGRRLVVGNTRRVSDTLQTRSVTRRSQRRSDVTTPVTSSTTPPPPARSGSLQPQQRQQQQEVSEPSQRLTGSIARRTIPTSVTEKQQQLQRRSFLRAHSGGYAAGGIAPGVGQLSTASASRSQTGVAAGSGSRSRQQVIGDRNVTDTRRDKVPVTTTCDSDNDNGSDLSSSCRSSTTAAATAAAAVNKRANVSWSRGTESVNQLTADFMNLLVSGHNADVIIETDDGELSCHSAILCARSEFFRDLLTSSQPAIPVSTVPNSSTKRILLQSHSSSSVRFLLAHLYTASVQIPDTGLDLFDLLALATRVSHAPLVRLLDSTVRTRLCHMFHKPCPVCIPGVFRCLAASIDLHLTSLTDRCVSWLTQHRAVVWSCPSAVDLLPQQLCVWTFNTTFQLSEGCVLDILSDCSRLMTSLTSSPSNDTSQQHQGEQEMKSESSSLAVVGEMASKLVNEAVVLASRCLSSLIASDSFMALSDSPTNCDLLERHLLAAAEIQNAADAVVCVDVLYQLQTVPSADWCQKFVSLISSLSDTCSVRSAVTVNKFAATPSMSASVHLPSASYQDDAADELAEMTALDRSYYDFRPCTEVTATASYTTTSSVSSSQTRHQTTAPIMSASFSCVTMNTEQRAANDRVREEPGIASAMSRSESFTICKHE